MTACPIRYQRQVSDRKGKIFYTSITSLSHISKYAESLPETLRRKLSERSPVCGKEHRQGIFAALKYYL
jgi:hypothetical protein